MVFLHRKVIHTTLDPIPPGLRACLGHIALNPREVRAVERCGPDDADIVSELERIALAEDKADSRFIYKAIVRKVTSKTPKLSPSNRMAMLRIVNPGRSQ